MELANKVVVITGAGSGIGRELALQALAKGAKVVGIDLSIKALEETAKLSGVDSDQFLAKELNITDLEKVNQLPKEVIQHFGSVDGLINCAGIIQHFILVNDLGFDEIKRVMDVNFYGSLYMVKAFLPHFLFRPEAHIVNVSSMGGFVPVPGQTIYGAAKAAVKLMTEGLYSELKDTKVRVSVVFPGAVRTNIMVNSGLETKGKDSKEAGAMKILSATYAAGQIIRGMEKNQFRILVGKDSKLMDFLYRLNPLMAVNMIQKKMKSVGRI